VENTSRLGSRDPVASGVKCGPHGGKNTGTKEEPRKKEERGRRM
jgi:hypothetical protein